MNISIYCQQFKALLLFNRTISFNVENIWPLYNKVLEQQPENSIITISHNTTEDTGLKKLQIYQLQ